MTLLLTNEDVERVLDMALCMNTLELVERDMAENQALMLPLTHAYGQNNQGNWLCFKTMEGLVPRYGAMGVRLVSDILDFGERSGERRRIQIPSAPGGRFVGLLLIFSLETSELLGILPEGYLQRMRVGATYGLGAKYLAREDASVLGLFGSGWQAGAQVMAYCHARPLKEIRVYSPTREHREEFCAEWSERVGVELRPVDEPHAAVRGADIVMAATNSRNAVLLADMLEPGMHFGTIMGEVEPAAAARATVFRFHGTPHLLRGVGGQLPESFGNAALDSSDAPAFMDVLTGRHPGRTRREEITYFPGGGTGAQFAALGAVVLDHARGLGLGRELPGEWFSQSLRP